MKNKKCCNPSYQPSQKKLEKYADVLINFALNSGKGINKGDVVQITCAEVAKPLFIELRKAVIKSGGHVLANYLPDPEEGVSMSRDFFNHASKDQLSFFPDKYMKGLVDQIDHSVYVIADVDTKELQGIDPKKIMARSLAYKPYMDARRRKEDKGGFTWTLGLYGTEGMAKEAGLSLKEYWGQIEKACYLAEKNPIKTWKDLYKTLEKHRKALNKITLQTAQFHVQGEDANLWITPGKERQWLGGSGRNIPSFELFLSPDWRGTEGWIRFNQPLFRYDNLVTGIELWFKDGKVVKSQAKTGEKMLRQMIATENANKVGEFSLTDKRYSKITKFMANTLYDENVGGRYGNTHIAVGMSYRESWTGDVSKLTNAGAKRLGFNDSVVHTDIVSTTNRTVTAYLYDGSAKVIYKDGMYQV